MARVCVLTMKFPRVTKIGQSIASMRTTPQVSGLGPVTVYIARFMCRAGLDPDWAYLFQLGSAHQKVAPGWARSTRLHCHLFCRTVLDPGRALSICGSVNVAYDRNIIFNNTKFYILIIFNTTKFYILFNSVHLKSGCFLDKEFCLKKWTNKK